MTDIEKARLLLLFFPGRSDCYGAGRGVCIKEPLTQSVVLRHIKGRERIGVYLLRMDGTTGALAIDIDAHNLLIATEYCARCEHYGLATHIERSKSKGYHVWWFFTDLVPARKARLVASYILDECELLHSAEVFPKRDSLEPGRYGNYINLPGFGRDVRRGRTVFLNPTNGYRPYRDQWAFLASMERISEAQLTEVIKINELEKQQATQTREEDKTVTGSEGMGLPCFSKMLQGVKEGVRNEVALRISVNLFRNGLPRDLAMLVMREWNKRNQPPLGEVELQKTVSNGYRGTYGLGCRSRLLQRYCDPLCPIFRKHNRSSSKRRG